MVKLLTIAFILVYYHPEVYSFSLPKITTISSTSTALFLFEKSRRRRRRTNPRIETGKKFYGSCNNLHNTINTVSDESDKNFSSSHQHKEENSNINNNNSMMITSLRVRGGDIDCASNNVSDEKEDVTPKNQNDSNSDSDNDKTVTSTFSSSNNSKSYYLIWSPGFAKQFVLATVILATIRYGWNFNNINKLSSIFSAPFISNIALPLLSSSCCAIQMAVNTLSSIFLAGTGCIGFNSMLGPVRPYLLALTLLRFQTMPSLSLSSISSSTSLLLSFLLRYTIVFMPEIVFWWNKILRSKWERQRQQMMVTKTATITTTNSTHDTGKVTTQPQLLQATLVVDVPTMGCVACVNKIESSLRQNSSLEKNISNTGSWLTKDDSGGGGGGCARIDICVESEKELDEVINIVINTIEDSGFRGTTIKSLDLHDHSSPSSSA